ncbi:MAG TPA: glycoside hydrolase family 28 protein [Bacteroidota bacterium]|nr:glycoside hydrolase family 28 protein [Bacteroidota bacterium]
MKNRARLRRISIPQLLLLGLLSCLSARPSADSTAGWSALPDILGNIKVPRFPDKEFDITKFGAVGDGVRNCADAFAKAIASCSEAGGGRVLVPEGIYLTGPIKLASNVLLYVSKGATVRFSVNPHDYMPLVETRWEGVECMNFSALIYAFDAVNVGLAGEGVLDGQGSLWWPWKGMERYGWKAGMPEQSKDRDSLFAMAEAGVPVKSRIFGEGHYLRPNFVQFNQCRNVLIEGVTFRNSPMWFLHPVRSSNVTIHRVSVEGLGPNDDGCDPESCNGVLVDSCTFNTGDDCVVLKSGRNADGRRVNIPCENVVVRGCTMKDGHGGVVLGSEVTGGIRNVYVEDCTMDSPHLERALRFKTNAARGGVIENFFARRIRVGEVTEAVVSIDFTYEEGDRGEYTPVVRNLCISEVDCQKAKYAFWIKAFPNSPVKGLVVSDCDLRGIREKSIMEHVEGAVFRSVRVNGTLMKGE